jgi:UDPglucose--hexose-1-phosphate uridylyltransferase
MPELRRNPTTDKWVIIATERAARPSDFKQDEELLVGADKCPFCEGREDQTPPEITSVRKEGTLPNTPGWEIRVIPNKFPALKIDGEANRHGNGVYDEMNGIGAHEIILESNLHTESIETLPIEHIGKILWIFKGRLLDLRKDSRLRYILIFKNKGERAGASLEHPHSQLIATPVLPDLVKNELRVAARYFEFKERCVYCDIITQEKEENKRVVFENNSFIAITPFASIAPFEVMILPKEHCSDFAQIKLSLVNDLAEILQNTLRLINKVVPNIAYNFYIHTSPLDHLSIPHYHWHIEILPRLTETAGFEWGSGLSINPLPPEQAAGFLKEAKS